ncbi:MAG: hypothetical protein IJF36_05270 [Oscillibacter sp.]|nr:hypothetical protein [Oscillibacter sp.]
MEQNVLAHFTVTVTSAENASWQGVVETNGKSFVFRSELQLLRWVMEQYPSLRPETYWKAPQKE